MSVWKSVADLFGFGETPKRSSAGETDDLQDLAPGQVVGEYVVEGKLGEGGFGAVYRAVHPVIGKAAAVKVLHPQYSSNPEMVSRFVSEARAVNQIRHRHIIDIFSFGRLDDDRHYYVMELLEGVTLDDYLEHAGRVEPSEALPILHAVAKALEAAHDADIAHRDLKPENIFLSVDDDGTVFPKILDFGVAKLLTDAGPGPMHKTHTGTPIGTPRYMSPEQCQGRKVDHRTDIYSLGVIAHRMLTGKLPFEARAALELMLMHVGTPPPRLSEVAEGLDPAMDEAVLRMLEKDPADRPATLSEAFSALAAAAKSIGVQESTSISISPSLQAAIDESRVASQRSDRVTPGGVQTPPRAPVSAHPEGASTSTFTNGRLLLVAAAFIGVVGVATAVVTIRPAKPAPDVVPALPAVSMSSAPLASVASSSPRTASPEPAPPSSVAWTFDTIPEGAEVVLGDKTLGRAPGPFKVQRSQDKRLVTIKAAGFEEEELELDALADRIISVELKRRTVRPGTAKPVVPKDLEYPY